jgi:hypothetical protein
MKKIPPLIVFLALPLLARGQGTVNFANSSLTLISTDGVPMPVSGTQQFNFAIFLGPSATVGSSGQTPLFSDSAFQIVAAYNTNSTSLAGRINNRNNIDVTTGLGQGFFPGSTVDFVVRGWSANAGATWSEALANWNNGTPLFSMFIGSSTVGNDTVLGPEFTPTVFGLGANQVSGFNMIQIPEPSSLAFAGLGAVALWRFRRLSP